ELLAHGGALGGEGVGHYSFTPARERNRVVPGGGAGRPLRATTRAPRTHRSGTTRSPAPAASRPAGAPPPDRPPTPARRPRRRPARAPAASARPVSAGRRR